MSRYSFIFQQDHADVREDVEDYNDVTMIYPQTHVVIEVGAEEESLMSLVAAFRALLRAGGFSDSQAKQVVLLKHDEVE